MSWQVDPAHHGHHGPRARLLRHLEALQMVVQTLDDFKTQYAKFFSAADAANTLFNDVYRLTLTVEQWKTLPAIERKALEASFGELLNRISGEANPDLKDFLENTNSTHFRTGLIALRSQIKNILTP